MRLLSGKIVQLEISGTSWKISQICLIWCYLIVFTDFFIDCDALDGIRHHSQHVWSRFYDFVISNSFPTSIRKAKDLRIKSTLAFLTS